MTFTFDAMSLGQIIAHACRAVLESHGLELTDDDQNTAGEAAAEFLTAVKDHQDEAAAMVQSVRADLEGLPVAEPSRGAPVSLRDLGIEPPV